MVRYYGYHSKVSRGKRKMLDQDALISSILEPDALSNIPCPSSQSLPAVCLAGPISGFMLTRSLRRFTRLWRATLPDF